MDQILFVRAAMWVKINSVENGFLSGVDIQIQFHPPQLSFHRPALPIKWKIFSHLLPLRACSVLQTQMDYEVAWKSRLSVPRYLGPVMALGQDRTTNGFTMPNLLRRDEFLTSLNKMGLESASRD
jgi:hypothetical protein